MLKPSLQGEIEADVEIKAPATKFYHMFAVRPQDLPKASPENLKGCRVEEGDTGKVGTLLTWNYVQDGKPMVAYQRIEAVEPKNNMIKYRVLEGDMMKEFKSFLCTIQVTPKQGGSGGVVKWRMEYERIDENVAPPESLLRVAVKTTKETEQMLLSNE
ncbi:MLP-like protein 28 [Raphanus sativus]|uniref:MLP-like protein 31 n=1 Tax=Raphanus sativus TaxID=3726 RepID=A0A6J0KID4_RAPSA|nr:MLP-like protein 31 [Raphanus sativus]KAJ4879664.1 MLP-like protein 28 [Raphanus sativus]